MLCLAIDCCFTWLQISREPEGFPLSPRLPKRPFILGEAATTARHGRGKLQSGFGMCEVSTYIPKSVGKDRERQYGGAPTNIFLELPSRKNPKWNETLLNIGIYDYV